MNRYTIEFTATCPVDEKDISYTLTIERQLLMILAEELEVFCNQIETNYHEQIADLLGERFPGKQRLTARHGTVLIETIRP